MSFARQKFFRSMDLAEELSWETLLIDVGIKGNTAPAMLRSGLVVTIFNSMETFMKERAIELFSEIWKCCSIEDFDVRAKDVIVKNALDGIKNYVDWNIPSGSDKGDVRMQFAKKIANLDKNSGLAAIPETFFWFKWSNLNFISCDEIFGTLKLETTCDSELESFKRRNLTLFVSFKNTLDEFWILRNSATHDWNSPTPVSTSNVVEAIRWARQLALYFDVRLSQGAWTQIKHKNSKYWPKKFDPGVIKERRLALNTIKDRWLDVSTGLLVKAWSREFLNKCRVRCELILVTSPKTWDLVYWSYL